MNQFQGLNGQQIAEIRERQICNMLDRFGFASAKSIAQFVYTNCKEKAAGVSARRTVKRLEDKKLILKRISWDGVATYVNTKAGAKLGKSPKILEAVSGVELSTNQNVRQERILERMAEFKKQGYSCVGQVGVNRHFKEFTGCHALAIKDTKKIAVFFVTNSRQEKIDYIYKWYKMHQVDELIIVSNSNSLAVENTLRKLKEKYLIDQKRLRKSLEIDSILKVKKYQSK
jgi:hypothetical protein